MFKKSFQQIIVFTLVGAISYFLQSQLSAEDAVFDELIRKAYVFHTLFSLGVVLLINFFSRSKNFFQQLGFIYIGALVFKIMVFTLWFSPYLLGDEMLPRGSRALLLIPVFIFLILEVFYVFKTLSNTDGRI